MWECFEGNVTKALDMMCPICKITVSCTKPDWLNNEIIVLMRKRDLVYKKARKTKQSTDWRKATFLRNRVDIFIKNYKIRKITENLNRYRNNPVKFWKEIRTVVPKDNLPEVCELIDEETGQTFVSEQLSNHINDYFVNIGAKLADLIIKGKCDGVTNLSNVLNRNKDGITNTEFTMDELCKILKTINVNKSSALSNIRAQVIVDSFL